MTQLPAGDWLTLKEAAAFIGISAPTLSVAASKNLLSVVRVGRQVMIEKSEVERYKKERRKPGRPKSKKTKKPKNHPPR
jgi:excisionase family DNA binding protein